MSSDAANPEVVNTEFDRIMDLLHDTNPYRDFTCDHDAVDLQGWGSDAPLLRQVVEKVRPSIIVEVGTWKGRSATRMAGWLKELGARPIIICVDTWLGSTEHVTDPKMAADLKRHHGYPQLYYTFLNNAACSGHQDTIIPFPNTSENAAVILKKHEIKADLVYIDASHEYDAALRDIRTYWPMVSDKGALVCDDFAGWPGVTAAFCTFVKENKLHNMIATWGKALVAKDRSIKFEL